MSLESVNESFHEQYDHTRDHRAPLVLVVVGDHLVVCRGEEREELLIRPPQVHALKALAHAPVAAFLAIRSRDERRMSAVRASLAKVDSEDPLRSMSLDALDAKMSLAELGPATRPHLLRATDEATRLHLAALHEKTNEALAAMSEEEKRSFVVVVTGDHQARARSVGMQYFRKRLREPEGREERVLYAEAVADVEGAIALVGTNRLDRELARAFFDDEHRLQRDVLGDAAKALLDAMELPDL